MAKRIFEDIRAGLEESIAIVRGEADPATYRVHVPSDLNVKAIRKRLGLTQEQFVHRFGFKVARLRNRDRS